MRPRTPLPPRPEDERCLAVLRGARRVLLCGHERPDADVLGSQGALASLLRSLGKEVAIVNPDPPAPRYALLAERYDYGSIDDASTEAASAGDGAGAVEAGESRPLPAHDAICLLDANERSRARGLEEALARPDTPALVVDHHPHEGEPWWDAAVHDPGASATGVLVWRIGAWLGGDLDADGAVALFTSLATDTGWFRYSNTNAECHRIAAALIEEAGVDPGAVHAALEERDDPEQPRVLGELLSRVEYHEDGRLAWVELPVDPGLRTDLVDGDGLLDRLRSVESVRVACFLREVPGGHCKLSVRSKGDYDARALCAALGGGGHARAAGATIAGPLAEVRGRVLEEARARLGPGRP